MVVRDVPFLTGEAIKTIDLLQISPRCWFQRFFIFTTIPGEMIQFDEHIFQRGWLKPPTSQDLDVSLVLLVALRFAQCGDFAKP